MQEGEYKLSLWVPLFKADRNKFRDTGFFHRHTVHRARSLHCTFVVGNDAELRAGRHRNDFTGKAADVCFVERRVNFVEQAKRRWTIVKDSKYQSERGHSFFAA